MNPRATRTGGILGEAKNLWAESASAPIKPAA